MGSSVLWLGDSVSMKSQYFVQHWILVLYAPTKNAFEFKWARIQDREVRTLLC